MVKQFLTVRNQSLAASFIAILGGLLIPAEWIQGHIVWFAVILILGGVPHGASDYLIFRQLIRGENTRNKKLIFGAFYILLVAGYVALWLASSMAAFILFILISVYHFGQSNWKYVNFDREWRASLSYMLWGGLVVGVPVFLYHEEASLIIFEITQQQLLLEGVRWPVIFLLLISNIINIAHLSQDGLIDNSNFSREITNLLVLTTLFITTPLLIGFGIYFVFWHSLGSTRDQINLFRQLDQTYSTRNYLIKLIPFTTIAFIGLAVLYYLLGDQMNYGINLGVLFLFISIITVPHSILMDRFYLLGVDTNKEH